MTVRARLTETQQWLLEIIDRHRFVTETTLAAIMGRGWHNAFWSCVRRGWVECLGYIDDGRHYVRVFLLTRAGRRLLVGQRIELP